MSHGNEPKQGHCIVQQGDGHSHHSLWCLMELHSVQPGQRWVVALIANVIRQAPGELGCVLLGEESVLQGQRWRTLASVGKSSFCVIMG